MHSALRIIFIAPALVGWAAAAADLPRKAPLTKYTGLWTNSPFTTKPPPPEAGPAVNPLEDYVLSGVSPISSGYRVTLLNKKTPDKRIVVETDKPAEGFKILSVKRKPGDPLGTVVSMTNGTVTGSVSFDTALLALKPAAAAPPPQPNQPPGVQPSQPVQPGQTALRQPRPRVVPPPPAVTPQPNQTQAKPGQPPAPRPIRR